MPKFQKWSKPPRCPYPALESCDVDGVLSFFSVANIDVAVQGPSTVPRGWEGSLG